jgi:N-methylhydantoinase A
VHAGKQAEELGIGLVIVPKTSPAFSALGLLVADYTVDVQSSYIAPAGRAQARRISELLEQMEHQATAELRIAGLAAGDVGFERYLNICYPGQTFDMAVPAVVGPDGRLDPAQLDATFARFHDQHEELHGFATREEEPILRSVRVHAVGRTPKPPAWKSPAAGGSVESALRTRRRAYFEGDWLDTPVYDGDAIRPGHALAGPAIIEERFTTIVLYPGQQLRLDEHGNYRIQVGGRK